MARQASGVCDRQTGGRLIWKTVCTVIVFFVVISASHEAGHLAVARLLGLDASIFSVGIGPKLASFHIGKTEYAVSLLPLGAYVDFPSDADSTSFTGSDFARSTPLVRLAVAAAGPLTNVAMVWLAFFFYRLIGAPQLGTLLRRVDEGSPAQCAGLMPGDVISGIRHTKVRTWNGVLNAIESSPTEEIFVEVERGSDLKSLRMKLASVSETDPRTGIQGERRYAGIFPSERRVRLPFSLRASVGYANSEFFSLVTRVYQSLRAAARKRFRDEDAIGSPILFVQLIAAFLRMNRSPYVLFPVLNISIAVMNFLPVPMLDGGHMALALIQMAVPLTVTATAAHWLTAVGTGVLSGVLFHAVRMDLRRIFRARKSGNGRPAIEIPGTGI